MMRIMTLVKNLPDARIVVKREFLHELRHEWDSADLHGVGDGGS